MEPSQNETIASSPLQRIAIGAGTLIVVILTVVAAVFLAMQDVEPTPITETGLTPVITDTPISSSPTTVFTSSPTPSPTDTPTLPSPTSTPTSPPVEPTDTPAQEPPTPTEAPPTATNTPKPPSSSPTFTPLPPPPTATSTPAEVTNCGTPPPQDWVAYTIQTGDSFNSLANRTNSSVFDLQQANCVRTLQNGDQIYLPFNPPPPTATGTRNPTPHPGNTPSRTPTPISPIINNVVPDRVDDNSQEVIVTILGKNFRPRESNFKVELRGPQSLTLQLQGIGSDTSFDAIIPSNLPIGTYDLVITNPTNRTGVRVSAFIIGEAPATPTSAPKPNISSVDPDSGFNDVERTIEVRGSNFKPNESGFRVELRIGQDVKEDLQIVGTASSTSVKVTVPAGLAADVYDVWVINPDGQEDVQPAAYESKTP